MLENIPELKSLLTKPLTVSPLFIFVTKSYISAQISKGLQIWSQSSSHSFLSTSSCWFSTLLLALSVWTASAVSLLSRVKSALPSSRSCHQKLWLTRGLVHSLEVESLVMTVGRVWSSIGDRMGIECTNLMDLYCGSMIELLRGTTGWLLPFSFHCYAYGLVLCSIDFPSSL